MVIAKVLRQIRDGILSTAYPDQCRVCGDPIVSWDDGVACKTCWEDPAITLLFNDLELCMKCGTPLGHLQGSPPHVISGKSVRLCGECKSMAFTHARSGGAYSGALRANLLFIKSKPHLCRRIKKAIFTTVEINFTVLNSDLIIPIPLHKSRRTDRGFNQAQIIAESISDEFGIPIDNTSLFRYVQTERHRAGMDAVERAKSVRNAFKVMNPRVITGASILLVDDLLTTGSTVNSATLELISSGSARVSVLTAARALARSKMIFYKNNHRELRES